MYSQSQKEELGRYLTDSFNIVFKNLVKEKCGNDLENENSKMTSSQIAKDLGITYQALLNYENKRIPEYKQLALIKDYFNVSYSYLLGETKERNLKGDGFQYDLSGSALEKLKEISDLSKSGNYVYGGITHMLENLLLQKNNEILKIMTYLLISKSISKKNKNINDLSDYMNFMLIKKINENIEAMSKELNLPNEILYSVYNELNEEFNN